MDILQKAKDRYKDARQHWRENHERMREDLRFSNPACPEQWDKGALTARLGRPTLTFDRTNQFIAQVVNDARQNKPAIRVVPADSGADVAVAEALTGIIRHIEYRSRAGIAYDTAIEHAARVGLGWLRVVPKVIDPDTNEQEIVIQRISDPLSVVLDPDSTEPDGQDAMFAFAETVMSKEAFKAAYGKIKPLSWESDGDWFREEGVRVCEYFAVQELQENRIVIPGPAGEMAVSEDEYWQIADQTGTKPAVLRTYFAKSRKVKWCKLSGAEILEETEFPSQWIGLIPVVGYELWVEGKRYVCGMTRRLMEGQRAYNYERSAFIEAVALQPKAPFVAPFEAIEQFENEWRNANQGNPAVLPYNHLDGSNNPLPPPSRLSPPAFPAAFVQGGQIASQDMEASVGMFKANLGQQGNETSGRAIRERKMEGDLANFHYLDNLSRSIEQLGRVVVDMIPRVYDTKRQAIILGVDESQGSVEIDPNLNVPARKDGRKAVSINPKIGKYDVRVKAGPSYTSAREEVADNIINLSQGNPQLAAALAPILVKMRDMPEADKIARVATALLPPPVQQALGEENDKLDPAVAAQLEALTQQNQQMQQALQAAAQQFEQLQAALQDKATKEQTDAAAKERELAIKAYEAETERLKLVSERTEAPADRLEEPAAPAATQPVSIVLSENEQAMTALAQSIAQSQAVILDAMQRHAEIMAQMQRAQSDGLAQIAALTAAPREISLVRDANGRAQGAISVVTQ